MLHGSYRTMEKEKASHRDHHYAYGPNVVQGSRGSHCQVSGRAFPGLRLVLLHLYKNALSKINRLYTVTFYTF